MRNTPSRFVMPSAVIHRANAGKTTAKGIASNGIMERDARAQYPAIRFLAGFWDRTVPRGFSSFSILFTKGLALSIADSNLCELTFFRFSAFGSQGLSLPIATCIQMKNNVIPHNVGTPGIAPVGSRAISAGTKSNGPNPLSSKRSMILPKDVVSDSWLYISSNSSVIESLIIRR